ncbi:hypothetical protein AB0929_01705 [Streptomyces massasporeus]|uniref:MmyB family transcriptional regulator n=1 Tax=Streptomyces massasporeus TaxID=67324 RepID=UPI003454910D
MELRGEVEFWARMKPLTESDDAEWVHVAHDLDTWPGAREAARGRCAGAAHPVDASCTALIDRRTMILTDPAAHDVRIHHEGIKRLQHPAVGLVELTYQSLDLPLSQRAVHDLSLYTAEPGSTSEERLKLLASLAATRTGATEATDPLRGAAPSDSRSCRTR